MAYTGRHRRVTRYPRRARSVRPRVVYAREFDSSVLTNGAAAIRTNILGNLETRIGEEIFGATILKMWGTIGLGRPDQLRLALLRLAGRPPRGGGHHGRPPQP